MTTTTTQPKIIAVFNQKGGCGKTMASMQLAGAYGLMGLRVFVVDMDPQNTSALWGLNAHPEKPFPAKVLSLAPYAEAFLEKLKPFADQYDVIIIDCPPALDSRVPWAALLAADFGLIPVIPEMSNVWASKQAEELVLAARKRRSDAGVAGELRAAYVLNKKRRGVVFDSCEDILRAQAQIPILESGIAERNTFPESLLYGCVARSFGKNAAATEIDNVAAEVAKIIGLKLPKKGHGK